MTVASKGIIRCPFRDFHGCPDGGTGSKGFSCLIPHLKRQHLCNKEKKTALQQAIRTDVDVFMSLEETLRTLRQWLCFECMSIQAWSRACKHEGNTDIKPEICASSGEVAEIIFGVPKPRLQEDLVQLDSDFELNEAIVEAVFRAPVCTVKSIPRSCRLAFSHALKAALQKVAAEPKAVKHWVRLLLLPRCTLRVFRPKGRAECRSGNRKATQQIQILRALALWGEPSGTINLVREILKLPATVSVRDDYTEKDNKDDDTGKDNRLGTNISTCLRKVADGHFTAAVKAISSSGVAPYNENTRKALEDKYPTMPPPRKPTCTLQETPLVAEEGTILSCIKSFPKGTSCGRDGLRAQHLLDAFCGEGSTVAADMVTAITRVVNLWLGGRCPLNLAEFIASAPLTPLLKPDKSIRPIAVGTIWRRLVSKAAMKGVGKDMAAYLQDFQFGVGVSGGVEAILHAVNRFVSKHHVDASLSMLMVDFTNAFNLVDRTAMLSEVRKLCPSISPWVEYLYGQPARLYVGDSFIYSSTGVQQGDPLGPLLFALVLHQLIAKINEHCILSLHAWYLDDGTVIGDTEEVAKALTIIKTEGPALGLILNIKKTEIFWPSCDGRRISDGMFPVEISRPDKGVKLLGGAVSLDDGFVKGLAIKRAEKAVDLMQILSKLHDPQSELLLLRTCMGISKLLFGLRICHPDYIMEAVDIFDRGLREVVEGIVVCGGPFFGELQWRLSTLPIRYGGLGLYTAREASEYVFVASRVQSWGLQDHILRSSGVDGMDDNFNKALETLQVTLPDFDLNNFTNKDNAPPKAQSILASALFGKVVKDIDRVYMLTERQKAVFGCLQAAHAQDFLLAIPIEGLGQKMSPLEYRSILKYRLMIPLYPSDSRCPACITGCLDSYGEHAVHCKVDPGYKYRHDHVRDILYDVLWRSGISAKKEAPVHFLTDPLEGRSTLRPADVLIFGWANGKHTCVDLTGVSPLVGIGHGTFTVGRAALKAASGKISKHEKACVDNGHAFVPFAFDTFGYLAPEAVGLLKRVQKVMRSNVMTPGSRDFIFNRIGFAIQKGLAAQLVARLPSM